ncbi:hypothetical protein A3A68_01290 [Candidatus Saccharibacteria bacterium RIFCSPLOWO2_01_FULL_48_13]|nr:MAG: hypothetical protein A3A68_01290 [Candidatus Saccharibacteria bacterium RIFCSPLOWO2_01_FULL_48_13]
MTKTKSPKKTTKRQPGENSRWMALARRLADSPLPTLLLISTFILSRWWNNSDFSYPGEVVIPIGLFLGLITIIYYGYRSILGPGLPTHVATIALSWFFYSYSHFSSTGFGSWLADLLPSAWQTEITTSIWLALIIAMAAGLIGWLSRLAMERYDFVRSLQPFKVLLFTLAFIFTIQLIRSGLRLINISDQLTYQYPTWNEPLPKSDGKDSPDIYYLVFDRYGDKQTLEGGFGYDNSDIYNQLSDLGFVNRERAYANYPFTMSSVASTMAMDYFGQFEDRFADDGNWQSAFPYRDILQNSPIAQALKQNGYNYNQISSWWDFTRVGIKADSQPTISYRLKVAQKEYYLSDLQRDIVNKSILSPWLKKGLSFGNFDLLKYDLNRNPQQNFEAQMSALKAVASRTDKSQPQFSFAHVLVPHDPYIFMPDGSTPSYDPNRTDNGVDETVKYTNSVTYLNTRIKDMVKLITDKSPNAVIVIQADEGPYPKEFRFKLEPDHYYDPADLSDELMRQKFSILASYRLPGVDQPTPFHSSVNVFRFILNQYLGYHLPLLPDCYLSTGDKFTIYQYQEVSQRLLGRTAPQDCSQYDPT